MPTSWPRSSPPDGAEVAVEVGEPWDVDAENVDKEDNDDSGDVEEGIAEVDIGVASVVVVGIDVTGVVVVVGMVALVSVAVSLGPGEVRPPYVQSGPSGIYETICERSQV